MNWEAIAQAGHEEFQRVLLENGVSTGPWENHTRAERLALIAQAEAICKLYEDVAPLHGIAIIREGRIR